MALKLFDLELIRENLAICLEFINGKLNDYILATFSDENGDYSTKKILIGAAILLFTGSQLLAWLRMKSYFKKLNLQGPTPFPFVGNFIGIMRKGLSGYDTQVLAKYNRTCGYFEGATPVILTSDPLLMKEVMIRESNRFINRRIFKIEIEPLNKFLILLRDDEWKNVRSVLSTAFTSGKIKEMSKLMKKCSENVNNYVAEMAKNDKEIDAKFLCGSYALDVISSCLFGFETNSINEPDNEFLKHIKILFTNSFSSKNALLFMFPNLSKFLVDHNLIEFFSTESLNFFTKVSEEIINRRKAKLETRADFIQTMVDHEEIMKTEESRKEAAAKRVSEDDEDEDERLFKWKPLTKTLTNKEILSQAILFLGAGNDTTSLNLIFISYNLAVHPDCQQKLCEEVDEVLKKHNGEINYESIADLKYMDMVISESSRLYPAVLRTERECGEDFEFNGIKMKKGDILSASIWALHHDPEIYPEPEKFIPERFSVDAQKTRDHITFLQFGAGPRMCLGKRFALVAMKIFLADFLSKYQFVACDKTTKKIKLDKTPMCRPAEAIILKVKSRHII